MDSLKTTSPSVITSRVAQNQFLDIKSQHADLVTGIGNQKARVDSLMQQRDQQKAMEMQNKQTMETEIQKEKMTADTSAQKNAMDFALKQSELDIKRAALMET